MSGNAIVAATAKVDGNANVDNKKKILHISNFFKYDITITPQNVSAGCKLFTHEEFRSLTLEKCEADWSKDELELYISLLNLYEKQMRFN